MTALHPMAAVRGEHRSGSDDFATTVAFLRAAVSEDANGMIALLRGLDPNGDDVRGIITFLAIIGGQAVIKAESGRDAAHAVLDVLAALERGT